MHSEYNVTLVKMKFSQAKGIHSVWTAYLGYYLVVAVIFISAFDQLVMAQHQAGAKSIYRATLYTRNIKTTAIWFKKFLGFSISDVKMNESAKLKVPGFQIQLIQPKRSVVESNLKLPAGKTLVNGFYETGFLVNNLDSIYQVMDDRGIKVDSVLTTDSELGREKFTAKDPDGNRISFYKSLPSDNLNTSCRPFLISLITSDYQNTLKWYETRLGFKQSHDLDVPIENMFVRILQQGNIVLKIIHSPNRSVETTELLSSDIELMGFKKFGLKLSGGQTREVLDNDGNQLIVK